MSAIDDRFEHGKPHNPIIYDLIKLGHTLEVESDYLENGGDGDAGENVAYLLSEVVEQREKRGWKLMWVKVDE